MNTSKQTPSITLNVTHNPKPFDKVFMLGLYTGHVFFNPKAEQYPLCLHLYDNTQDKVVYVGYFSNLTQLSNQVHTYILDKYTENNVDYNKDFLSISINSMIDALDMCVMIKLQKMRLLSKNNMFSVLHT